MDKEHSIEYAKRYVEDLLSFFGLNTVVGISCEEDVIEISIPSTHLNGFLIGQGGETLRSIQYLVSMALKNKQALLTRVNVDVASYKRHRIERLAEQVREWCKQVQDSQKKLELKPMNAADRRIVHHVVDEFGGLTTVSEGEGANRHVVIAFGQD